MKNLRSGGRLKWSVSAQVALSGRGAVIDRLGGGPSWRTVLEMVQSNLYSHAQCVIGLGCLCCKYFELTREVASSDPYTFTLFAAILAGLNLLF